MDVLDLVLLRHGQSAWNAENLFTGWVDVDLTPAGEAEATAGGELLAAAAEADGLDLRILHTSVLTRAIRTAELALHAAGRSWLPVRRDWRLNERHYGDLQGKNKSQIKQEFGEEQLMQWRRSYDTPPPPLLPANPYDVAGDPRYRDLDPGDIPRTECLKDVVRRVVPYWESVIVPDLRGAAAETGGAVLVAAHGNSIRALRKHLEEIADEKITGLEIPTGIPYRMRLDDDLTVREAGYLGDPRGGRRGRRPLWPARPTDPPPDPVARSGFATPAPTRTPPLNLRSTQIEQRRAGVGQPGVRGVLIGPGPPGHCERVLAARRVRQGVGRGRTGGAPLDVVEPVSGGLFVVADESHDVGQGGELRATRIGRDRPRRGRLPDSRALGHERHAVPVVHGEKPVLVEAHVARRPVGMGHDGWPLVCLAPGQRVPRVLVDPFGPLRRDGEVEQRTVRLSIDAVGEPSQRVVGQLGRRRKLPADRDHPGQAGRRHPALCRRRERPQARIRQQRFDHRLVGAPGHEGRRPPEGRGARETASDHVGLDRLHGP